MKTISDVVRIILRGPTPLATVSGPKERGALRVLDVYGQEAVLAQPVMVNFGVLADVMADRVVVHALRPGACRLVDDTDLHSLPEAPPKLLTGGWILEARHAERGEPIFGNTIALAGYRIDDAIHMLGVHAPDGVTHTVWRPKWGSGELPEGMVVDRSPLVDEHEHAEYSEWARQAARFALVLGLLLESEAAPVKIGDETEKGTGGKTGKREWVTRHIALGAPPKVNGSPSPTPRGTSDDDDAALTAVNVRGHLKRQRHGPEHSLVKWIYVAEYSARRWVSPRPLKVVL